MGDIGIRCVFGRILKVDVNPLFYEWSTDPPRVGDTLYRVDGQRVLLYTDYVEVLRQLRNKINQKVLVEWGSASGERRQAWALVRYRPLGTYIWSFVWFLQEMLIFGVGAHVFWKRPRDESARLFFWLCIVTVGAFMGGYHWSEIVIDPPLIYLFAAFAVFVPVVSLHFYLVFPRANPVFVKHRQAVLRGLYGIPSVYLLGLWASMGWSRYNRRAGGIVVEQALTVVKWLALGYIPLALAIFVLCILCLAVSIRSARSQAERNQVRWILLASLLSLPFITYLLRRAYLDPAMLGLDSAAWPMLVVSLLFTLAYALSITRYKLMEVEEIYNRSKLYFLVSVLAGLLYSGVLVVSALLIGFSLSDQPSGQAMVVALTASVILIVAGASRRPFQKAIDRRFYREKYKFDQAMRRMSQAVERLVDRQTLGRRLLEAADDVLRLEWGAIYLSEGPRRQLRLVACHGPEPDQRELADDNPLVQRLRQTSSLRLPHTMALTSSDPATDAMIALGGEVATALEAHGDLAGLLVLGPKRSGMPYEDEEIAFLGALASVATLALHSAVTQLTLETLNRELRDKVEKIAEQQRRILILQVQLMDRGEGAPTPAIELAATSVFDEIKGSGPAVRQMIAVARKVAASPSAVLILGESGTGKELLAEAIHAASARAAGPFVKVHCAALSQSLLESELFGHVKGAFTGADRDRVGRFEQAHGGTLFLDEIGDINLEVQTKLLRVLQEMAFERVGSSQPITVDVRIVAATHQDLDALIRAARFREDLYYRLNVISLRTPPLRERKVDIFELSLHFLRRHAERVGKPLSHLDNEAIEALVAYDWPGNIRELENVLEAGVVLADGPSLGLNDLPEHVRRPTPRRLRLSYQTLGAAAGKPIGTSSWNGTWNGTDALPTATNGTGDLGSELGPDERQCLVEALAGAHNNKSEAARLLGMPRSTFFSKLKKHGLV
jgi:transcriptional regulator with GAF, ATPase, and Fis domain